MKAKTAATIRKTRNNHGYLNANSAIPDPLAKMVICISMAETLWLPVEPGVAFQVSHCLID
jgi:hypothetical protein